VHSAVIDDILFEVGADPVSLSLHVVSCSADLKDLRLQIASCSVDLKNSLSIVRRSADLTILSVSEVTLNISYIANADAVGCKCKLAISAEHREPKH
jgi:hypothetical protein